MITKKCEVCQLAFVPYISTHKVCSDECRKRKVDMKHNQKWATKVPYQKKPERMAFSWRKNDA